MFELKIDNTVQLSCSTNLTVALMMPQKTHLYATSVQHDFFFVLMIIAVSTCVVLWPQHKQAEPIYLSSLKGP